MLTKSDRLLGLPSRWIFDKRLAGLLLSLGTIVTARATSSDINCRIKIPVTHPSFTATLYNKGNLVGSLIWTGFSFAGTTAGWMSTVGSSGGFYTFSLDFLLGMTGDTYVIVRENTTGALLQTTHVNVRTTHELDSVGEVFFTK